MLHLLRRNVDVKVVLFNNRVYGLTKGQASPTSPRGTRSKTTPDGSTDNPVEPIRFVRDLDYPDKGFRSHWIQMNLHIGTHADAPMHTEPGGRAELPGRSCWA